MGVKSSDVRKLVTLLKQKGSIGCGARNPFEPLKTHLDTDDIEYCRRVVQAAVSTGSVSITGTINRPEAFEFRGDETAETEDQPDKPSVLVVLNDLRSRSYKGGGLVEIECRYASWDQLALALGLEVGSSSDLERCVSEARAVGQLEFEWNCSLYPPRAVFLFDTSSQRRRAA